MQFTQRAPSSAASDSYSVSTGPVEGDQSSRQEAGHVRFSGLFMGLSNPRGGTSISSSLLPIRPDSEDEEDYDSIATEADGQYGRGIWRGPTDDGHGDLSSASPWHHHHQSVQSRLEMSQENHIPQQGSGMAGSGSISGSGSGVGSGPRMGLRTGEARPRPTRPSRYPPPEIVADLIQRQIVQGLAEATTDGQSASVETQLQPNSSTTSLETVNNSTFGGSPGEGSMSANSSTVGTRSDYTQTDDAFIHRGGIHRRRLRSSSLRGLLGFQPMGGAMTEERLTGSGTESRSSLEHQQQPELAERRRTDNALDGAQVVDGQIAFFSRFLSDLGRGLRGQGSQGRESDHLGTVGMSESQTISASNRAPDAIRSLNGHSSEIHQPDTAATAVLDSTAARASASTLSAGLPSLRPRRHTTIRFIQIGGSDSLSGTGRRSRSGSVASSQGTPRRDRPESTAGLAQEDLADAIIMFLSNAGSGSASDAESSEVTTPTDETETGRTRSRRSPWVMLTLSGAYLSNLLAGAGADGEEGGMSYDDLWMLSNLIGPARPITTTQEAIDSAGFHVGQYENALQGMRDCSTLGDGSKCLVCMSDYEEGEDMRALNCKHGFHQECIDKWLTTGANKCPVCRAAAVVPRDGVVNPSTYPGYSLQTEP
ncbi:hypothetical protein BGX28_006896 [Mortierella sp. GBA30]|nr:hypothetical protein BGX28_006896 [Mortierella sp. GBA30]